MISITDPTVTSDPTPGRLSLPRSYSALSLSLSLALSFSLPSHYRFPFSLFISPFLCWAGSPVEVESVINLESMAGSTLYKPTIIE